MVCIYLLNSTMARSSEQGVCINDMWVIVLPWRCSCFIWCIYKTAYVYHYESRIAVTFILTMLNELFWPAHELCYTAIPMVVCLVGVELFCRNFIRLALFSVKVAAAGLVYIQVREFVRSSFGADPLCIESRLFGVPPGTINTVMSIGLHVVKARVLGSIQAVCPKCIMSIPPPVEESEQWGTWLYL
jgi:hypothetical protein